MWNRLIPAILVTALPLSACKEKAPGGEEKPPAADPGTDTKADPTDAMPAEPELAKLSETALPLFEAATETSPVVQWVLAGEQIVLRAVASKLEGEVPGYDVKVMGLIKGGEETEVFACKGIKAVASGHVDVVLRGDKLHVLCINPAMGEDKGTTDAGRFDFDLGKRAFSAAGTYGGDGSLDLDTIDLDETE